MSAAGLGLGIMSTDLLAALRNASNALSACSTVFSATSRTASGTCMVIFGSIADFSFGLLRDVATVAASAGFAETRIWPGRGAFFRAFFLSGALLGLVSPTGLGQAVLF